jgi:DNA-binding response OmpR family regulator
VQKVVLIAHEDPELAERYLDALDAAGFACLITHTGSAALETASGYSPQVAVVQIELPDVQGTDVCLRLKQESKDKKLSVLLLGKESQQERFVSNEVGADAFAVEPVSADTLVHKVRELFLAQWQVTHDPAKVP